MAPKRRDAGGRAAEEVKRYKRSADKVKDEFTCSITTELFFDPVTAEDGHLYERSAIEEWIARPGQPKSPKTNVPMGRRLTPATEVRNIIDQMVRDGLLDSPAWSKKLADEKEVERVRARAEGGDTDAMRILGDWYLVGKMGLSNLERAFGWYQRGHRLGGCAMLTANLALCYLDGLGVEQNVGHGMHLMTSAAERGSEFACFVLGAAFVEGMHGLPQDAHTATHWYRAMESATERMGVRDNSVLGRVKECRDHAAAWLRDNAADA